MDPAPLPQLNLRRRSLSIMANVVDTKLYDILGVSPSASENELKKVGITFETNEQKKRGRKEKKSGFQQWKCGLQNKLGKLS